MDLLKEPVQRLLGKRRVLTLDWLTRPAPGAPLLSEPSRISMMQYAAFFSRPGVRCPWAVDTSSAARCHPPPRPGSRRAYPPRPPRRRKSPLPACRSPLQPGPAAAIPLKAWTPGGARRRKRPRAPARVRPLEGPREGTTAAKPAAATTTMGPTPALSRVGAGPGATPVTAAVKAPPTDLTAS